MDNIINWEISDEYIDEVASRRAEKIAPAKKYWYEMYSSEAYIIATYFTNVWLHANEHVANVLPGTYPARSYDGSQMQISIGRYEVTLAYEFYVDSEDEELFEHRWIANIIDSKTNDVLELFVQTECFDVISYISSQVSEKCARGLANEIIHRCHNEFGVDVDRICLLGDNFGYPIGMEVCHA